MFKLYNILLWILRVHKKKAFSVTRPFRLPRSRVRSSTSCNRSNDSPMTPHSRSISADFQAFLALKCTAPALLMSRRSWLATRSRCWTSSQRQSCSNCATRQTASRCSSCPCASGLARWCLSPKYATFTTRVACRTFLTHTVLMSTSSASLTPSSRLWARL